MIMRRIIIAIVFFVSTLQVSAAYLLVPMDETQRNHLKSYGVAYWALEREVEVTWLLNYRGGAFMMKHSDLLERECKLRGVTS